MATELKEDKRLRYACDNCERVCARDEIKVADGGLWFCYFCFKSELSFDQWMRAKSPPIYVEAVSE